MLRLAAFLTAIGALFLAILGLILLASGLATHSGQDTALGAALVIVPTVGLFLVRRAAVRQGRGAFLAALRDGFAADQQGWYHGSGLALDSRGGRLLIAGPDKVNAYPLEAITGVRHAFINDAYYSGGPFAAILIVLALARIIIGYFTNGMFVSFTDGSQWRIAGISKSDAKAWGDRLAAASGATTEASARASA